MLLNFSYKRRQGCNNWRENIDIAKTSLPTGAILDDFIFCMLAGLECELYLDLSPMQVLQSINEMIIGGYI